MPPKPKQAAGPSPLGARQGYLGGLFRRASKASLKVPIVNNLPDPAIDDANSILSAPSLPEIKDDSKLIEELQAKTETVKGLEERVATLTASLDGANASAEEKQSALQSVEQARTRLEQELSGAQGTLRQLQLERSEDRLRIDMLTQEVIHHTLSYAVRERLTDPLSQLDESKSSLSDERVARLKVVEDLESLRAEHHSLQSEYSRARATIDQTSSQLHEAIARTAALTNEVMMLQADADTQTARASDLEAEVRAVAKERDSLLHQHDEMLARVHNLENDLSSATSATQRVAEDFRATEAETHKANESVRALSQELDAARVESAHQAVRLEEMSTELASVSGSHALLKEEAQASVQEHLRKLEAVEKLHEKRHAELEAEAERITGELEASHGLLLAQEKEYRMELGAVKIAHREEVESLMTIQSEMQLERDRDAATIEELQAKLGSALKHIDALDRRTAEQSATLREADAELAKCQAAFASASHELDALRAQAEQARQRAQDVENMKDEIVESLSVELAHARDAHAALKETFLATDQHAKELEGSVRRQEKELEGLREAYRNEVSAMETEIAHLQSRRDAEGTRAQELQVELEIAQEQLTTMERQTTDQHLALEIKDKALVVTASDLKSVKSQLEDVRARIASIERTKNAEIARLKKELAEAQETRVALSKTFNATKEKLARRHAQEAEESARSRTEEIAKLKAAHQAALEELERNHRGTLQEHAASSAQQIETRNAELETMRVRRLVSTRVFDRENQRRGHRAAPDFPPRAARGGKTREV
ncbi:hypothetical protein POSPLADRAFT_1048406 [Postia placenta MAD-698-R-SB12]|uniref:Uncharacterized protein n=1 Tax=Postia placenta MAD-698-R-SB12 TaxID=670580 RepID=A0A1X6MUA3_9APHY|nr:hypothetical protein POSPLADRAFT_1048406 [Postia placenta MAD-698-R-SB12]OSX59955.1 hypothetical protein POSPLADRAFT_1048406 [Postia placenta MAD-698-R-SB12]